MSLQVFSVSLEMGGYKPHINDGILTVKSQTEFSEVYLWDSKENCRCIEVDTVTPEGDEFLHTFKTKVHKVSHNITDRKYVVEFLKPGVTQDVYQLSDGNFRILSQFFSLPADEEFWNIKITQTK